MGNSSRLAKLCNHGHMGKVVDTANIEREQGLGADLLAVVARLNRLANPAHSDAVTCGRRPGCWPPSRRTARPESVTWLRWDHCSQPTMTTQVRRLRGFAGLVSRIWSDPGDARAVRIRITPDGKRTPQCGPGRSCRRHRTANWPSSDRKDREVLADAVRGCAAAWSTTPSRPAAAQ